jgi:hypothetical protein
MRKKVLVEFLEAAGQAVIHHDDPGQFEHREDQVEVGAIEVTLGVDKDDVEIALLEVFQQLECGLIVNANVVVFARTPEVRKGNIGAFAIRIDRPDLSHRRLRQRHP